MKNAFVFKGQVFFVLTFLLLTFSNASYARKFYISASTGNDTYTNTQAQNAVTPWKTLVKVQNFGNSGSAMPGDTFAFKNGDVFINGRDQFGSFKWWSTNGFSCPSGTASKPIVFTSYGTGDKPNFLFPNPCVTTGSNRIIMAFDGVNYIVIDGLQFNDTRFPINDKVSTAYSAMGILLGEDGVLSKSNNCTIKNCFFNNIGFGVSSSGENNVIQNNVFTNFKNVGDTSGTFDVGAIPIILGSGKRYRVIGNLIKGGWAFSGATASGKGLNGAGIEIINDVDSSFIGYNTIIDCAGAMEVGQNLGNSSIGANDDTIAYNKFINTSIMCYVNTTGVFSSNSSRLRFWNNVFVENKKSRFNGPAFGSDVYNDGQSFSGFPSWPLFPKNPGNENFSGRRVFQYPIDNGNSIDTLFDIRNNVFWADTKIQLLYDNSKVRTKRVNNIFRISGDAVLGGVLNAGNFIEISTMDKIFTDTSNLNPENWNFNPHSISPAINFGRNVGLNAAFDNVQIVGNPDAGIHEYATLVGLSANAVLLNPINCNGQITSVNVTAIGGTPPYSGTGVMNVYGGQNTFTVRDANNASAVASIDIPQPTSINISTSNGNILSFGGSTSINVAASGGTPPYQYKLNNGSFVSNSTFTNVIAGTHTIAVRDTNGCLISTNLTLNQPSLLTVTVTIDSAIKCNGGSTTVKVIASGGVAPYSGTGTFNVMAGTYNYIITDANGISVNRSITVSQPNSITANVSSGSITTFGAKTTITVSNAAGGTSPYSYSLNGGAFQTSTSFSNVAAGTHSIVIRDSKPCSITRSITITQPASTLAMNATSTRINCNGASSTVTVSATGGSTPYSGTGTFSVFAGTRTFTVTDALGATKSVTLNITQPSALSLTINAGRIITFGGNTTISAIASGGVAPYKYKLNNGSFVNSPTFAGIFAGTYTITISDSNNCTQTASVQLNQPLSALAATVAIDSAIRCNGGLTTLKVTATGGTSPYVGTGTFQVGAGSYNYTVTDSNGVSVNRSITVSQPNAITGNVSSGSITTFGARTTITVSNVAGGTSPYTYSLNGGAFQTSTTFSNVSAGNHIIEIRDSKLCFITRSITITQPASTLAMNATSTRIICNGASSTVTVTASGGTAPYTGTGTFNAVAGTRAFTVTDAVGSTQSISLNISEPSLLVLNTNPGRIIQNGGSTSVSLSASGGRSPYTYRMNAGSFQTNATFTGVLAGTYSFSVRDSLGCIKTNTITITQPSVFNLNILKTNIICKGGQSTVTISATGGTAPYTGTGTFLRSAGTYTFSVTDSNGVVKSGTTTITEPSSALVATVTGGSVLVSGGTSSINISGVSGGTSPYTYSLNGGTYQTGTSFSGVLAGVYTVNIKDAIGCVITRTVTVNDVLKAVILNVTNMTCRDRWDGTITVGAQNGRAPYVYRINNFNYGSNSIFRLLGAGTYTLYVKDANGAVASKTAVVASSTLPCTAKSAIGNTEADAEPIEIHPNPTHDYFTIKINTPQQCKLEFYDQQGRLLEKQEFKCQTFTSFGSNRRSGVYFVKMHTKNGVESRKLIKL